MKVVVSVIGLAVLCLVAACGKPGGTAGASAAAPMAGAGPTSGPNTAVTFADLPHPRAGLWQTTTDDGDGHPDTSSACLSGAAPTVAKMPAGCDQPSIKRTFTGSIVVDATCKTAQFSMTAHSVSTGDFQSHVTTESESTMTMAGQPPRTSKLHIDAHWVGPCPPDQKPVDAPDLGATN
jgi:hypothetical protein